MHSDAGMQQCVFPLSLLRHRIQEQLKQPLKLEEQLNHTNTVDIVGGRAGKAFYRASTYFNAAGVKPRESNPSKSMRNISHPHMLVPTSCFMPPILWYSRLHGKMLSSSASCWRKLRPTGRGVAEATWCCAVLTPTGCSRARLSAAPVRPTQGGGLAVCCAKLESAGGVVRDSKANVIDGGDWTSVAAKAVGLREEGTFRTIVGFL